MQPLLLGFLALVLVLIGLHLFRRANTQVLARRITQLGGLAALTGAAVLASRNALFYAMPLAAIGVWLLIGTAGSLSQAGQRGGAGRASAVVTEHLDVELDLDTGELSGRVLKGLFAGRAIDSLKLAELALLWQDCRVDDPASAQILEAYLDRLHPNWREDVARGEREMGRGPNGRMTTAEAYNILGLKPGATAEDIRRAHRDLMLRMHPDRGGSSYLAAKINEAKDVLLGK